MITMIKPLIVGNWKSNKTIAETEDWFRRFQHPGIELGAEIILCPAFTALERAKICIERRQLPIKLAAQDISPYPSGAYTGEISGELLKGLVSFVLIGHSERRIRFKETDFILKEKVLQAKQVGIEPIYCIPDEHTKIPEQVNIVAFEPISAIGTGQPDTPEHADAIAVEIKKRSPDIRCIYGGSIKPDNVVSFLHKEHIDGVLPGGASLDPLTFYELIKNAAGIPEAKAITSPF